jgi:hypothetical protein
MKRGLHLDLVMRARRKFVRLMHGLMRENDGKDAIGLYSGL